MGRKQLVRDVKRAALARMEEGARTAADFEAVVTQWNHLDDNRERRERDHEIKRNEETIRLGYSDGLIFPIPVPHFSWRQAINGDFLDLIFDNAEELWQLVGDTDVSVPLKALTRKQKEVLFLIAVRGCSPQQIACYKDKTDRAIRKLLVSALNAVRRDLAPLIQKQIEEHAPDMTLAKRSFLVRYEKDNAILDNDTCD